jgi:antitoxin YefM
MGKEVSGSLNQEEDITETGETPQFTSNHKGSLETAYLLRSPKNARRLLESIHELESGGGTKRELVE